ncbi:hypothetical protein ACIF85_40980 [Streptomyces sp. NPDC086033]|uniref:hypothetical protein n=1 Tax=Streptomyces sp. NPDC086033 TaxID=3365747 RepID=UPI0037D7887D
MSGPHLFTAVPGVLPSPRLPDGPRRLGEGRARRHQVVDQHDQPFGQQTSATGDHGQRAREIVLPLPRVEPRLVGHPPPLPQYGHHPRRHPRPAQHSRRRERDPPRRIMPPSPNRPPRGRHGNKKHRHTEPVPPPPAPAERPRPQATPPDRARTTQHATRSQASCSWHISTPGQSFYSPHATTPSQSLRSWHILTPGQDFYSPHATTPSQSLRSWRVTTPGRNSSTPHIPAPAQDLHTWPITTACQNLCP